jgi:aminodeoxyfutalosine deaminase
LKRLERARERAERELGLSLYWIFDAVRHFTVEEAERVFRKAAEMRQSLPLHHRHRPGRRRAPSRLGALPRPLRRSGPRRPAPHQPRRRNHRPRGHLGGALHRLGAHRPRPLRHPGPKLVQELKGARHPLELNPTSNVRTGVCASFAEHPLRRYFDAGLLVTLNSDDPAFFGSDVANEYLLAHTEQGFTREELRQLAANSIRASFLPEPAKAAWLSRIDSTQ